MKSIGEADMSAEFFTAVKQGDREAVERMVAADRSLLVARDENGVSAILLAYYHGKDEVARALIARKPALDIFEAATAGDAGRVGALVAKDRAQSNAWSKDGFFPLGLAAFFKRPDVVKVLLENGADVRMASRPAGFTPLHSAVADDAGQVTKDLVRMLLDAGADPNAKSASGGTPVHTAAFTGNISVLRMLLDAGGDASARDKKGHSPLDVARERGNTEAAAMLHDAVIEKRG
jgi:ankyrin repeat protein